MIFSPTKTNANKLVSVFDLIAHMLSSWTFLGLYLFMGWEGLGAGGEGMTEDEMAGWHHWLDGSDSEWTLGVGDGQGGLACCDSWGHEELDTTEQLNWTELKGCPEWEIW